MPFRLLVRQKQLFNINNNILTFPPQYLTLSS